MKKAGFSLLEVILALAILGGAIAVLGEASRLAMRNAEVTRDLVRAQMLCETRLSEIVGGMIDAASAGNSPFDPKNESLDPNEPGWRCDVEVGQTDETGLISVRVTVTRDLPAAQKPVKFSLVRWMADPNATTASEQSSGSSKNSTAGGSSGS
jgi:type II secretion system protein I